MKPFAEFFGLLNDSCAFFAKRSGVLALFIVPILFSFLLLAIINLETYTTMGGIFLRYEDIKDTNPYALAMFALLLVLAAFFHSTLAVGVTLTVLHMRTQASSPIAALKKEFLNFTVKLFNVRVFIYIFNIMIFVFARFSPLAHLLNIAIAVCLTFVPQSIVIEEARPLSAIKHSVKFVARNFPLVVMFYVVLFLLHYMQEVFLLLPGLYEMLTIAYVNALVLPFLEILASFIYLEKYQIAKRSTHLK